MTKGGSSPVLVENGSNKMDGNVAATTPTAKKRGFFSGSFRRRRPSADIKLNDTIIINENVVFNGKNGVGGTVVVDAGGGKGVENGKTAVVEQPYVASTVNDKKPPLQQKQDNKKAAAADAKKAAADAKKAAADAKKAAAAAAAQQKIVESKKQQQQQADKKKAAVPAPVAAATTTEDKKKAVTKRGNRTRFRYAF